MSNANRRSSRGGPETISAPAPAGGTAKRGRYRPVPLRLEFLEDRSTPSIVGSGIPTWLDAGPAPTTNGQVSIPNTTNNNPVDGASSSIVAVPGNPNVMFAAGVNGGVWRTMNATAANPTWTPLTDILPSLSVSSLAINVVNANQIQLLAGVGNTSSLALEGGDLIGAIYTDNALAAVPTFRVLTNSIAGVDVRAVALEPGYMLVLGDTGLYRSIDDGVTFTQLSGTGTLPAISTAAITAVSDGPPPVDMVVDPFTPTRVYVASPSGLFRTDNIAAATPTWIPLTDPISGISATSGNIKLAINSTAAGSVLYVGVTNQNPNLSPTPFYQLTNLSYTTDMGATWTAMDLPAEETDAVSITGASNAGPIQITTSVQVGGIINNGDQVVISGVGGNTAANGVWTVTITSANTFTLNGSTGNGTYTSGGSVRLIYGVQPSGQGEIHFALAADPVNPNIVYISGDTQNILASFPNLQGSTNFSGNVLIGNRTLPQKAANQALSPQWTPVVDNGANGTTPHADSRHLSFDDSGNLLEADDGGVYVLDNPSNTAGGAPRMWFSLLGNMGIGELTSVSYDSANNVVFAGTQDTGSGTQQDGTGLQGNTTWDQIEEGDGGTTAFASGITPGVVYRYTIGNGYSLERNAYSTSGVSLGQTDVQLASAPGAGYLSGLSANDQGFTDTAFDTKYVINSVNPNLFMLGGFDVYQSPTPDVGLPGDVITTVTPTGMQGFVSAVAYGGFVGTTGFANVAYVGTDQNEFYFRGPAANAVWTKSTLPATATGQVDSIAVDPSNYKNVYVLDNNHVYQSTDGGVTFTDITGTLVGTTFDANGNLTNGLTTMLTSLTVWDPAGNTFGPVLLAAGRGGVFRYAPGLNTSAAASAWSNYGVGLPNTLYTSVVMNGNHLTAGSLGRGAWVVPDVSTTITVAPVVQVTGGTGPTVMSITGDLSNPDYVDINDGQGNTLTIKESSVQGINFTGLSGDDTFEVLANGQTGGDLEFVRVPISVTAAGGAGDTLLIENAGRTTAAQVTITSHVIGAGAADTLFTNPAGEVIYNGFGKGTVSLDLGATAPEGNSVFIQSTSAAQTNVDLGTGFDTVKMGSSAGLNDFGNLAGIAGNVTVDGRGAPTNTLLASNYGATSGDANVVFGPGTITGFAGPAGGSTISYTGIGTLTADGSNSPTLAQMFTVQNPTATLVLSTDNGPSTVNIQATTLPVTATGGTGADAFHVSSLAGTSDDGDLSQINGAVSIDGGAGNNSLVISNYGSTTPATYNIVPGSLVGIAPAPINFASTGGKFFTGAGNGLLIRGSHVGGDTFNVNATLAGSETEVQGNGGNDVFNIAGDQLAGTVWLNGGTGSNNQFTLNTGSSGVTATALHLTGGGTGSTAVFNGIDLSESNAANPTNNVTISVTSPTAGTAAGLGTTVNFDTFAKTTYAGAFGRNLLTVVDATGVAHGTPTDPADGIVFEPLTATSGEVRIADGTVGPLIDFTGVNGTDQTGFVINGDPTGQTQDSLAIVGASDPGLGATGALAGVTATNGSDTITVSATDVTIQNSVLGYLRSVGLGTVNGASPFSAVLVYAGEAAKGNVVTITPSALTNLFVDGGVAGDHSGGNQLVINTTQQGTQSHSTDPTVGPPQTRVTFPDGSSFGFVHFVSVSSSGGTSAVEGLNIFAVGADAGGAPASRCTTRSPTPSCSTNSSSTRASPAGSGWRPATSTGTASRT
ncbi:beta strand repeat-containing protein [Fimbriiglobus ruber]|uniref:Flagellar hook-length control protein FliK n=1 Tax=Fimbriiglobus ruber TaxID=1908690 RepID=A0A225D4W0_9BACT|nr:hypothetical protein [Fimbriiglobus ruber]OWK35983.1 Flagellar hook-length control protein FliK [Fimbriiglobus ruber]